MDRVWKRRFVCILLLSWALGPGVSLADAVHRWEHHEAGEEALELFARALSHGHLHATDEAHHGHDAHPPSWSPMLRTSARPPALVATVGDVALETSSVLRGGFPGSVDPISARPPDPFGLRVLRL